MCYIFQAFWRYISTVASCRTEELSGDNSLNFYWLSLNQPCCWTDGVVYSCFGVMCRSDAIIVFYVCCVSFSFRGVRGNQYALEVLLYYFLPVCCFAFCFSSCLFLSAVETSFTLPFLFVALSYFPCILFALGADPSYY